MSKSDKNPAPPAPASDKDIKGDLRVEGRISARCVHAPILEVGKIKAASPDIEFADSVHIDYNLQVDGDVLTTGAVTLNGGIYTDNSGWNPPTPASFDGYLQVNLGTSTPAYIPYWRTQPF